MRPIPGTDTGVEISGTAWVAWAGGEVVLGESDSFEASRVEARAARDRLMIPKRHRLTDREARRVLELLDDGE